MTRDAVPTPTVHDHRGASDTVPSPMPGPRLAGYRVLRRGPDRHGGRVFHAAVDDAAGSRTSATIVVFDGDQSDELAMRLVERLELLEGESIPRVLDVCLDEDGNPSVVLDSCGDALSSIMTSGLRLQGGEVVTIVAPVLAALTSIHDRGFAHGGVSPASIAIGSSGRPVLLGCERATDLRTAGDRRERDRRAGDDLRAFADLVADLGDTVLDMAMRRRAHRAAETIRAGAGTPFSSSVRSEAEVRLFEIAEPVPLTFTAETDAHPDGRAERAARSLVTSGGGRRRHRGGEGRPTVARRMTGAVRIAVMGVSARVVHAARAAARWSRSGGRRRRILIAAASGAGAAVALVLVIPAGGSVVGETGSEPTRVESAAPAGPATAGTPEPMRSPTPSTTDHDVANARAGDERDDAVAGMRGALDVVGRCAVEANTHCWDDAFEQDSALLDAVARRGSAEVPAALLLPVGGLEIVQREDFGDARLIVLTPQDGTRPASVLIVRTEAGWRIREVFET